MSVIRCTFASEKLNRKVRYILCLPEKGVNEETKTIMFLHGVNDCCEDWLLYSPVIRLFKGKNTALIFPDGENSFYVNHKGGADYGDYFGEELVHHLKETYHLSGDRRLWKICGYSMGGYGALQIGWKYAQNFSKIAAFSSALVVDNAVKSTEDAPFIIERRSFFEAVFGDLDALKSSDKDLENLIPERIGEGYRLPMVLKCGTEDFLLEENRQFHAFLEKQGIDHVYQESPGTHNWDFWTKAICDTVEWLLEE